MNYLTLQIIMGDNSFQSKPIKIATEVHYRIGFTFGSLHGTVDLDSSTAEFSLEGGTSPLEKVLNVSRKVIVPVKRAGEKLVLDLTEFDKIINQPLNGRGQDETWSGKE